MTTKEEALKILQDVADDEPIFILRGKEKVAPIIVDLYAIQLTMQHMKEQSLEARFTAQKMREWQEVNNRTSQTA
jgi:hypothetical protein